MRPKIQLELALHGTATGEARSGPAQGTEAGAANPALESPPTMAGPVPGRGPTMEAIVDRDNLRKALAQVRRNKGAPGVDAMSVEKLAPHLKDHWPTIRAQLLAGAYEPQPVRRVEIEKASGGMRPLGIPTVLDRFIQQAAMQVLQAAWDGTFSASSYGFRPGRSAHQAVRAAQAFIASGRVVVVDIDLEKFFDRVNHDILMGLVAERVTDKRVLRLIRSFLTSGVLEGGLVCPIDEGTPQGGPLSPLLSNLMLDELDKELERRGHCFARYADDCNIYVCSRRAGERVMAGVAAFLARRLKLTINREKSAVAPPQQRKFLGFSFTSDTPPRRRIAPQALERFKRRVRSMTKRTRGASLKQIAKTLSRYLIGWRGYFGSCETPLTLRGLDRWIRRRLRALTWKQWKTGATHYAALRRRGLTAAQAAQAAGSAHGAWRLSRSQPLHSALPNTLFTRLGLASVFG
jgi:RNA-directed DNA polymerase